MAETTGQRFRRLGDELRELTDGEHYFIGVQGVPTLYLFSFGTFHDAAEAQEHLDELLRVARNARGEGWLCPLVERYRLLEPMSYEPATLTRDGEFRATVKGAAEARRTIATDLNIEPEMVHAKALPVAPDADAIEWVFNYTA